MTIVFDRRFDKIFDDIYKAYSANISEIIYKNYVDKGKMEVSAFNSIILELNMSEEPVTHILQEEFILDIIELLKKDEVLKEYGDMLDRFIERTYAV